MLPVLYFYITIDMLDAGRLACVPLMRTPVQRKSAIFLYIGGVQENLSERQMSIYE